MCQQLRFNFNLNLCVKLSQPSRYLLLYSTLFHAKNVDCASTAIRPVKERPYMTLTSFKAIDHHEKFSPNFEPRWNSDLLSERYAFITLPSVREGTSYLIFNSLSRPITVEGHQGVCLSMRWVHFSSLPFQCIKRYFFSDVIYNRKLNPVTKRKKHSHWNMSALSSVNREA